MTAKQYLQDKELTGVEIIGNKIINLVTGDIIMGLDIDMTGIPFGMSVNRVTNFSVEGDLLKVGGTEVNLSEVKILG
jgi:hypothetical protein